MDVKTTTIYEYRWQKEKCWVLEIYWLLTTLKELWLRPWKIS